MGYWVGDGVEFEEGEDLEEDGVEGRRRWMIDIDVTITNAIVDRSCETRAAGI